MAIKNNLISWLNKLNLLIGGDGDFNAQDLLASLGSIRPVEEARRIHLVELSLGVALATLFFFEAVLQHVLIRTNSLHALDGFVETLDVDCSLLDFTEVVEQLRGSSLVLLTVLLAGQILIILGN